MFGVLSHELQEQFIGDDALATFTEFIESMEEGGPTFDTMSDDEKLMYALNLIFSKKDIFFQYIEFIGDGRFNDTPLRRELFLYVCDYFSGLVVSKVDDILKLPNSLEILQDMYGNTIPGTSSSYASGLGESKKRGLTLNSKGEVIYFIKEQNNGYLVYSHDSGSHLVDSNGAIILYAKGDEVSGKIILEKMRLYRKFLLHFSGKEQDFSPQELEIRKAYIDEKIGEEIKRIGINKMNLRLLELKLRFALASDIWKLERDFHLYRDEIMKVKGGTDLGDGGGEKVNDQEVANRIGLIELVK